MKESHTMCHHLRILEEQQENIDKVNIGPKFPPTALRCLVWIEGNTSATNTPNTTSRQTTSHIRGVYTHSRKHIDIAKYLTHTRAHTPVHTLLSIANTHYYSVQVSSPGPQHLAEQSVHNPLPPEALSRLEAASLGYLPI